MQTEQLVCWSGMTDTEHSKQNRLPLCNEGFIHAGVFFSLSAT